MKTTIASGTAWSTRRVLTAAGLGGLVAAGAAAVALGGAPDEAAAAPGSASSAQGVRASGTGVAARSADSGSISGAGWSASGISTETRPGYARAAVASITVGGQSIGSVTTTCRQGVTTVEHSDKPQDTKYFHVFFGKDGGPSATGVTVRVTDRDGNESLRLTGASAACAKDTGPTGQPTPPPTGTPGPPTGHPTGKPEPQPTHRPGRTPAPQPGRTAPGTHSAPDREATPAPLQHGHGSVTG